MLTLLAVSLLMKMDYAQAKPAKKPQAAKSQLRQLLDAPVYYLSFRMHITAAGAGSTQGGLPSSYSVSIMRDVEGDITLGGRSQGPSLSAMDMATAGGDPTKFIDNYCTWMAGAVPAGEPQTDANRMKYMNDAIMNYRGTVQYSLESHAKMPIMESDELQDVVSNTNYSGKSTMSCPQPPMFEINGLKKTFKLLVAYDFDDPKLDTALGETVTTVSSSRETHTDHTPIKQALWMTRPLLDGNNEPSIKLEGKLPTGGATISGSWTYPVVVDGAPGTMVITAVLAPKRSEQAELVVSPPKDYANWRPMAGADESTEGNTISVQAHLQKVGGGVPLLKKIRKIEGKLLYTSNERGICINWPPSPDATMPLDMKFVEAQNKGYLIDTKGQSAVDTTPKEFDASLTVTSFDYGGTAELQIIATLNNGEQVIGKIKSTGEETLYLPKRAKANGFIAESFLKKNGVTNQSDSDDLDDKPEGNGYDGDGLTLYEEYRGFMEASSWATGNPKRKELFVLNKMRGEPHTWKGIRIYEAATKIKVHSQLTEMECDTHQVINFNHTMRPHVVDQHVIYILEGEKKAGVAFVQKVGTPGVAKSVTMPPDWKKWLKSGGRWQPDYAITIAHEMMHGSSVHHHGQTDQDGLVWYVEDAPAPPHWVEREGFFDKPSRTWVWNGAANPVILKKETGEIIPAIAANFRSKVWLTTPGGQHSGDNECIMKYNCATGYPAGAEPNTRYVTLDEYAGVVLCTDPAGTGVNDPNRALPVGNPQSRQGPADRGDCVHQLCINDKYVPPSPQSSAFRTSRLVASTAASRLPLQDGAQESMEVSSPFIAVGANDVSEQAIKPGWPLIVSATLIGSDGTASAIPAGLSPKLTGIDGNAIALTFEPLVSAGPDKTLSYWIASATSNLSPGDYLVTLTGSTTQMIAPASIKVVTGDEVSEDDRRLLAIQILLITGKIDEALSEVNAILVKNPDNVRALTAQGDILMSKDDFAGAMNAYSVALGIVGADHGGDEGETNDMDEDLQLSMRLRDAMKAVFDALPSK